NNIMKNLIFITITIVLAGACRKHEIDTPSFDAVLVEKATYKAGEELTFSFSGEADQIVFYSGESLHDYAYSKESRKLKTQAINTSFRTNVTDYKVSDRQSQQLEVF